MSTLNALILRARTEILHEPVARFWSDAELLNHAIYGVNDLWRMVVDLREEHFFTIEESGAVILDAGDNVVVEVAVSADPNVADPDSVRELLTVEQPARNHNGGMIAFGPDGYLYIGMGDGGSRGDPHNLAQDPDELLGKMLRIDVDGGEPYAIPPDNPFADGAQGRPEIYALGLRNPWRFSFDRATGDLYAADVGQNRMEEINVIRRGGNYGWRIMEGTLCFEPRTGCDPTGLELPIAEYRHARGRCSITGGYVYRGEAIPELVGAYLFSDYCEGVIRALDVRDGELADDVDLDVDGGQVVSFVQGPDLELYALDLGGTVWRLDPA
jgi:glucose/arabinose dehydrogenase